MNLFSFIEEIAKKQAARALRQIKRGIVQDHDQNKIVALLPENQGQSKIPIEFYTDGEKGVMFIPKNGARVLVGEPQRKKTRKIIGIYPSDVDKDDHVARVVADDEIVIFSKDNVISIDKNEIKVTNKDNKAVVTINGANIQITANTADGAISVEAPVGTIQLSAPQSDVTVTGNQGSYGVAAKLKDLDDRVTALEKG